MKSMKSMIFHYLQILSKYLSLFGIMIKPAREGVAAREGAREDNAGSSTSSTSSIEARP